MEKQKNTAGRLLGLPAVFVSVCASLGEVHVVVDVLGAEAVIARAA